MGKNIIQQARGRGGPTYRVPSFKFKARIKHRAVPGEQITGVVKDILKCRAHSAPLAFVEYEDKETNHILAPEGLKVGDIVTIGQKAPVVNGNCMILKFIPEGTFIHNIENNPGDGGKLVRASGNFARVISQTVQGTVVELPSKSKRIFNERCRASIGIIAGGGRLEKPLLKAGMAYYKWKAKNKIYPKLVAAAANAVDHPYGCSRTSRKGRPTIAPKNASPGRKVGMIRPPTTGRGKLKEVEVKTEQR